MRRYQVMVRVGNEDYRPILGESYRWLRFARKARDEFQFMNRFYEDTANMREITHITILDQKSGGYVG